MTFGHIWFISITILLCYNCSSVMLYGNEACRFEQYEDEYKNLNISNPLDRQVNFLIYNTQECWLDTTDLYVLIGKIPIQESNNITMVHTFNLITAIKLVCSYKGQVHFKPVNSSKVTVKQMCNIVLILACPAEVKEIHAFLKFGKIIMLRISHNPKVFVADTNCQYAEDLKALMVENSCETGELPYSRKSLFWEACKNIFSKTIILSLELCLDISITTLQEKFPNVCNLNLRKASLDGVLQFPWNTNIENETNNTAIADTIKLWLNFVKKPNPYQFPFSEKSLRLNKCQIKQTFLNFTESVDEIQITGMAYNHIQQDLFHNTIINNVLDLSENGLQTVDENLFQYQHLLKFLYLRGNRLTHISRGMFRNLRSVVTIDLSHNSLRNINHDPFQSLFQLKEINLGSNLIAILPENMFRDQIKSLRSLHLYSNPLTEIPVWPLYASNLEVYTMDNANITGEGVMRLLDILRQIDIIEKEVDAQSVLPSKFEGGDPQFSLQFNKIKTIPSANMTVEQFSKLQTLMSHYTVVFNGNPLTCNCDTFIIRDLVEYASENEPTYSLNKFTCVYPIELRGRHMWSITDEEMYCPVNLKECPPKCKCFKRKVNETIIIDCRGVSLGSIPTTLPFFKLELWFENSNISDITHMAYLKNVTVLNLARNRIKRISPLVINSLKNAQTINLHSNNLTSIPIQIRSLHFSKLTLSNNPFICDCMSRWMKTWLLTTEDRIVDWASIQCLENSSKIIQLIALPDSHFICKPQNLFNATEHVFLPSVITGCILFVLVLMSLIGYCFRFNIKVLLFIYFNLHPFDKNQDEEDSNSFYDAVLIYIPEDGTVMKKIDNYLQKRGHEIADLYTNSLIGYTRIENIEKLIACSKSIILCLPDNSDNCKIIHSAWNIAYNKFITSSIKSIILITDKRTKNDQLQDDSLRLFMRSKNCVDRNASLLLEKINYLMPLKNPEKNNGTRHLDFQNNVEANHENVTHARSKRVIISYPDELHFQVKNKITAFLSRKNFTVKVLDMLFTVGEDMREELPYILDASHFVIFIMNEETLNDEIKLYILTEIVTKAQLENHNYLLLCTSGSIHIDNMTNELLKYVENYVTLSMEDQEFQDRILESLTQTKCRKVRRDITDQTEMIPLL